MHHTICRLIQIGRVYNSNLVILHTLIHEFNTWHFNSVNAQSICPLTVYRYIIKILRDNFSIRTADLLNSHN